MIRIIASKSIVHDKNYTGGWDSYFEPKANTDWGKWGRIQLCPSNGFGIGFDLRVRFIIGMDILSMLHIGYITKRMYFFTSIWDTY